MTTEEIIKAAFELGVYLSKSQELTELKSIQTETMAEPDTYALIMNYQDAKTKLEHKYNDNLAVSPAEVENLDKLEQLLNENADIARLMEAQERFDNLMQAVYFAMNQAIAGGDCSSGCESCGGGCCC